MQVAERSSQRWSLYAPGHRDSGATNAARSASLRVLMPASRRSTTAAPARPPVATARSCRRISSVGRVPEGSHMFARRPTVGRFARHRGTNVTMHSLRFAFLICLFAVSEASAQTAQGVAEDFSGLRGGRAIAVIDDSGKETRGRLLRFTPDSLTMTVDGRDLVLDRQHVTTIYERGDSLKNGMRIGLLAGAAVGIAAGVIGTDCGGLFEEVRSCTGAEKVRLAAVGGGVFGAIGMGIGVGIDALITGRRLLYERPRRAKVPAISIVPSFAPSSTRLMLSVAW